MHVLGEPFTIRYVNISVIIPVVNEAENLGKAIESAKVAGAFEVIVVDGGSSDQSCAIATVCGAQLIKTSPGRGIQLQAGAQVATGDVLLFLHADNRLAKESCQQIAEAFADTNVLFGGFRQQIDAIGYRYRFLEFGNAFRAKWLGVIYGDQAIFVCRETLAAVGGIPELPLMEDVELMRRLRRRGKRVLLDGPLRISARRWQRHGVFRQTLRNWTLLVAYFLGVSPGTLSGWYRRHDVER